MENKWLIKIEALDQSDIPVTLRFSSGGYIDSSANYYDDRVIQAALFTNALFSGSMYNAPAKPGFGEIVLANSDGGLDYLVDYSVDGRICTIELFKNGQVNPVLTTTTVGLNYNGNQVSVRLKDYQALTDLEHPHNQYAGDNVLPNGLEGVSTDIKGSRKPKVYGSVENAKPVLVNTARYIYQVHDDSINPSLVPDITSVYDRGVLLTKHSHYTDLALFQTDSVPSGKYITYKGYFKLGSVPSGEVTCDVVTTGVTSASDVLSTLIQEVGLIYDQSSKEDFPNYDVGLYINSEKTTSAIIEQLCNGVGYYWFFDGSVVKTGKFEQISNASTVIDDSAIIVISRSSSGAGTNGLPYKKVTVSGDKVETVQTDLASSVPVTRTAKLQSEYRESFSYDSGVYNRHPLSEELRIDSYNRSLSDCESVSASLLTYFSVRRDSVDLTAYLSEDILPAISIGASVLVKSYKLGYSQGRNFTVVGYTLDARRNRIELKLLG